MAVFIEMSYLFRYHDYIIHVCRNDISGFVPQEDAKDRIDITHVFRQY